MYTAHRDAMTSVTPRYAERLQVSPPLKVRKGGRRLGYRGIRHDGAQGSSTESRKKNPANFAWQPESSDGLHIV